MIYDKWCMSYFILAFTLISSATSSNCVYEVCFCNEMFITCDWLQLTAIPPLAEQTYGDLVNLVFDNNQISAIEAGSLPSGLKEISFQHNPIATIADHAFDPSASTLQSLTFSQARFTKIPNAFSYIKALTELQIYDTNIIDWNADVMNHLSSTLESLIISNVTLAKWPDWLSHFGRITELSLVNCLLTSIPDDALEIMADSLVSLTLTGNFLTTVPKALSNLTALSMLYIDMNKITDTKWLPSSSQLLSLSLNNNNICNASQFSQSLRPFAKSITDLDIVTNELTSIPELDFLTVSNLDLSFNLIIDTHSGSLPQCLTRISLDNNLLPSVPTVIAGLKSLTDLGLSNNAIKEINGWDIPTTVLFLDLSNNQITALTDTSFVEYSNITSLNMMNNPLTGISNTSLSNLPQLVELYIGNTGLTRLPLGLAYLNRLRTLDVSDIDGLVCTCEEKGLQQWIVALSFYNVVGWCGQMSVYQFFSILSPSCP